MVALHRTAYLARANPKSRVLLTTFSSMLANALDRRMRALLGNEPEIRQRVSVDALDAVGVKLFEEAYGKKPTVADPAIIRQIVRDAASTVRATQFSETFLGQITGNAQPANIPSNRSKEGRLLPS